MVSMDALNSRLINYPNNGMPSNGNGNSVTYRNGIFRPQAAIPASSWSDLQVGKPLDPRILISGVSLGGFVGTFVRSTNALQASWLASPIPGFTGNNTKVVSLDTTDSATGIDCAQWTLNHQMVNVAANIPPILNATVYCRSNPIFANQIEINLGAQTYNNVQWTFLQNLATSGQFLDSATGSIPVILFGNGFTGTLQLQASLIKNGVYQMGLIMQNNSTGFWSVFVMELVVLP